MGSTGWAEPDGSGEDWALTRRTALLIPLLAAVAGVITGIVGGVFRRLLVLLGTWRSEIVDWAHGLSWWGFIVPVVISAVAAMAAAWIAKLVPLSGGSGIQHVEAVDRGQADPPPLRVMPARFVGGLLSIGVGGMVLGREGPTVHMGAVAGAVVGRWARATMDEIRSLQTVLSGAGLAVAFNAPIGGALFAFEEVSKKLRLRDALATLAAVVTAITAARMILGDHADFDVLPVRTPGAEDLWVFVLFGLLVGLLGVYYNRLTILCLDGFDALRAIPPVVKAGMIGALIGVALFVEPLTVGGGDALSQMIVAGHGIALPVLLAYLAVRFLAGPLSYAAGTPGGLFAPMLALGALMGVLFGRVVDVIVPGLGGELTIALAVVGMSTLFTAVVRAPFTGVVLVMEMTATTTLAVPMAAAAAMAVVVASLMKSEPVYDNLRERMLRGWASDSS